MIDLAAATSLSTAATLGAALRPEAVLDDDSRPMSKVRTKTVASTVATPAPTVVR